MYIWLPSSFCTNVLNLLYTVQKIDCCKYNVYNQDPTLSTWPVDPHLKQNLTNVADLQSVAASKYDFLSRQKLHTARWIKNYITGTRLIHSL